MDRYQAAVVRERQASHGGGGRLDPSQCCSECLAVAFLSRCFSCSAIVPRPHCPVPVPAPLQVFEQLIKSKEVLVLPIAASREQARGLWWWWLPRRICQFHHAWVCMGVHLPSPTCMHARL